MSNRFAIDLPPAFSFRHTVRSHGWYDLRPFEFDEAAGTLTYVFSSRRGPVTTSFCEGDGQLKISFSGEADAEEVGANIRHVLRFDDELTDFYELTAVEKRLKWAAECKAGRLLRSSTVWEDLVKTICTTNCSWGLTKNMVDNLVENLGKAAADGRKAFPTPEAMAGVSADFYRDTVRAGYRSPYFAELAELVAAGSLDPESWLSSPVSTAELKKEIKKVKGVGDYAAENLLKLLGRYDGLALDSWLRAQFYKHHNNEKACPDKKIEKHYRRFGKWQGLAIWCDMTENWFDASENDAETVI